MLLARLLFLNCVLYRPYILITLFFHQKGLAKGKMSKGRKVELCDTLVGALIIDINYKSSDFSAEASARRIIKAAVFSPPKRTSGLHTLDEKNTGHRLNYSPPEHVCEEMSPRLTYYHQPVSSAPVCRSFPFTCGFQHSS